MFTVCSCMRMSQGNNLTVSSETNINRFKAENNPRIFVVTGVLIISQNDFVYLSS